MTKPKQTIIHVVPSFHYDVAYTKTFRNYLPESLANLKAAIALLDKYSDYTYCIEQVVLLREYWKKYPHDRAKLQKYARAGRLYCAPGMWTMPDSNIPSGESFIRNALLGRKWLQKHLGITPSCCWMADIFGHNPQSPQLARTCGFTSYMFERGKTGSWRTTFGWKGIDGTVIPAQWQVDTYYGLNLGLAWARSRPQDWIDRRITNQVIVPLQKGSPDRDLLMTPLGGDFLKPTQEQVEFVRGFNRRHRDVQLRFSRPEAYFQELDKRGAVLPEESEDLNPLCEGCFSVRSRLKQANRRLEELAGALEVLECLAGESHRGSEAVWTTLAFNAFHDIICGSLVRKAVEEALAKYHRAETAARAKVSSLMVKAACPQRSARNRSGYLVFNSLPYARREIITLPGSGKRQGCQAVDLPSLGFAYVGRKSDTPTIRNRVRITAGGRAIENGRLKLIFGQNGTLVSVYDKDHDQELAVSEHGMNNPVLAPDIGDPWIINGMMNGSLLRTGPFYNPCPVSGVHLNRQSRVSAGAADADCYDWPAPEIITDDPLEATVRYSYPNLNLRTQITLRHQEKLIRIKTTFIPFKKKCRLLVAFPTSIGKGRIRHSVPFGHLQRPEGEYAVQGWMDYADKDKGLLVINRGLPGNNVTKGVMMLSLFRAVSLEMHEKIPWYEEGIEHAFEYGLMPFSPRDKDYNPARVAALFNRDVCVTPAGQNEERARDREPLIELLGNDAEVSCLRREGNRLRVRLWESRGRAGRARCVFAHPIRDCRRTDAADTGSVPLAFRDRTVDIKLKPFEIVTFRVEMRMTRGAGKK